MSSPRDEHNNADGTFRISSKWDVVVVPFPFTDINKAKPRPALVLSNESFNEKNGHSVLLMITTASNITWTNDVNISDLVSTGLDAASIVRMKMFTIDNRIIRKKIGVLGLRDRKACIKAVSSVIGD